MPVWDTSLASRLRPEGGLVEQVATAALEGEPIKVAAPTVAEIFHGLQRRADEEPFANLLAWFRQILGVGLLEVLPLNLEAAILAGRLRAMYPVAPTSTGRGRTDTRSKPERRVAWVADIQIASCAWLQGEAVCTADQGHFDALAKGIAELFPEEAALEVLAAPV